MSADTPLIFFRHDAKFMQARSSLELLAVSLMLPMLFHAEAR
jgi:hypothetical protein